MISQELHFNMFQYVSIYFNIFHKSSQNGCWTYPTSPLTLRQINPLRQDIGSRAGAGSMDLEVHSMREALSDSVGWGYIFSGMNIHLPAILGFARYQGFDPSPWSAEAGSDETTVLRLGNSLCWYSVLHVNHAMFLIDLIAISRV